MQTLSVADAKARLTALPTQVEAGEEVVITRRGVPIARIVAEPIAGSQPFDLAELFAFVDRQPCILALTRRPLACPIRVTYPSGPAMRYIWRSVSERGHASPFSMAAWPRPGNIMAWQRTI